MRKLLPPYGASYEGAIDLSALRRAHKPKYAEQTRLSVDGNTAAAIPFLQWYRSPIVAGFPITPATKWLEHLAAEAPKSPPKRVKLLESEHAAADYITGVAAACRGLVVGTATSSVGLDHMAESTRSLGASGLGNVIVVDVSRATANYPLCIEGDPSDALAHRDDGFIQVSCRGKQQIYDTLLQLPAIGMDPRVLTPTMPIYCGIKDSHRVGQLTIEPDAEVNDFLDQALGDAQLPPGLLDGDTSMGNCTTSAWFQGFKADQKARQGAAFDALARVAALFEARFGRPGIAPFETFGLDDADVALVCMGPDAGTAIQLLPRLTMELGARVGLVVLRLLTPFPSRALAHALSAVDAIGVVNHAHHHGRGHLTLDVIDALAPTGALPPVEAFFCGMGGADVSVDTWRAMARFTAEAAANGHPGKRWRILHEGVEISSEDI
jgi:pyruvate ferredoxin oxidoreductase alpha subunit